MTTPRPRRHGRGRRRRLVVTVRPGAVSGAGSPPGRGRRPTGRTVAGARRSAVQSLYAQDLVARINAERAARTSSWSPIPQLQVDAGARTPTPRPGRPTWPPPGRWPTRRCRRAAAAATQICVLAANSGDTGYGFWPGDGSDGMDGDYMASAAHRQNQLGAAYTDGGRGRDLQRQPGLDGRAVRLRLRRRPVGPAPARAPRTPSRAIRCRPARSWPAPPAGDPVYCPGQTIGPNGAVTATGGQYPYPFPVPAVRRRAQRPLGPGGGHGRHAPTATATGWPGRTAR